MTSLALRPEEVTMVTGAAHNPSEPRHYMRVKPVNRKVRVLRGGTVLAETTAAVRLLEVGKDLYDPVLYLPRGDIRAGLRDAEGTTHCPLKGDAVYFDLTDGDGTVLADRIAWSYPQPFGFADEIAGLIAFYGDKVTIEESPL